jgi:nitric oxide reductase subunit B
MIWRLIFGLLTIAGAGLLAWDLLTIGKGESRPARVIEKGEEIATETAAAA